MLSTGVLVMFASAADPMRALLEDVASGGVVDLEARLQERRRLSVTAVFLDRDDMVAELFRLAEGDDALLPIDEVVERDARLTVTAVAPNSAPIRFDAQVRGLHNQDGDRACRVVALGDEDRMTIGRAIRDDDSRSGESIA